MTLHRASRFAVTLALLGGPAVAGAQAFGLNEIGSCAIGRGFANTGAPCQDASTIYWNPGAMPATHGWSALAGAAVIKIDGDFTRDTSFQKFDANVPTAIVPHAFVNYRTSHRLAFGAGLYVPYGLTSQWHNNFPGRFSAQKASLTSIYVQPNVAFQLNDNWSVGGGPVIGRSNVELIQGIDLATQHAPNGATFGQLGFPLRTEFASVQLKGSAMAYGVNVGIYGRITPAFQVGARYLSALDFKYDDADATFTPVNTGLTLSANSPLLPPGGQGGVPVDALLAGQFSGTGALVSQKVHTRIKHPAQFQAGFGYTYMGTTLSADYAWVGWQSFDSLPVQFQGPASASSRSLLEQYKNTNSVRLGLEHRYFNGHALRAGFAMAQAAAPDVTVTPLLPEMDREYGTLGGTFAIDRNFSVDGAFAHIFTPGRRGRIDERTSPSQTAAQLNSGAYTLRANIFSLSLRASL